MMNSWKNWIVWITLLLGFGFINSHSFSMFQVKANCSRKPFWNQILSQILSHMSLYNNFFFICDFYQSGFARDKTQTFCSSESQPPYRVWLLDFFNKYQLNEWLSSRLQEVTFVLTQLCHCPTVLDPMFFI